MELEEAKRDAELERAQLGASKVAEAEGKAQAGYLKQQVRQLQAQLEEANAEIARQKEKLLQAGRELD